MCSLHREGLSACSGERPLDVGKWLPTLPARAGSLRLYAFPHAAGGTSSFEQLRALLERHLEVVPVLLPGRGKRLDEAAFQAMPALVAALDRFVMPTFREGAFALFGHSMGAKIAYELAHLAVQRGLRPTALVVSGCPAPQLPDPRPQLARLPDADFLRHISALNGIPEVALADPEFLRMILPALRADYRLSESYVPGTLEPLDIPLVAIAGDADAEVTPAELAGWQELTTAEFRSQLFSGDHFFFERKAAHLAEFLENTLGAASVGVARSGTSAAGAGGHALNGASSEQRADVREPVSDVRDPVSNVRELVGNIARVALPQPPAAEHFESALVDLGLESIGALALSERLRHETGVEVSVQTLLGGISLDDLARMVSSRDALAAKGSRALESTSGRVGSGQREVLGFELTRTGYDALSGSAEAHGVPVEIALITAYAEVVKRWSGSPDFTVTHVSRSEPESARWVRREIHYSEGILGRFTSLAERACSVAVHGRTAPPSQAGDTAAPFAGATIVVWTDLSARVALAPAEHFDAELFDPADPAVALSCRFFATVDGGLSVQLSRDETRLAPGLGVALFEALKRAVTDLSREPEAWLRPSLTRLSPEELDRRERVNATAAPVPEGLLHTRFVERARRTPHATALITSERTLTYAELDQQSDAIARALRARGLQPHTLVAILCEKSWQQVAAALGVLKAGAAYLPLDPDQPEERLADILRRAGVRIAIVPSRDAARRGLVASIESLLAVDDCAPASAEGPPPPVEVQPADLAYVIFTSGSTGKPKGVMIDHRGPLNTVEDVNRRQHVGPGDRVLGLSSLSFDLSVYDIFGPLSAGGALVLPDADRSRDPSHWLELMDEHGVTIWNSVPALMEMLTEYTSGLGRPLPSALRLVMLSGDWIPVSLPDRIRALRPEAVLWSLGGATEASIWSIQYAISSVDPSWTSIPYGTALSNQQMDVLDDRLEPCPDGVVGRIHIGGVGLAIGYWGAEALTAERFVAHPLSGKRLYWTGDLGRWLSDGNIEFLGREDQQVKIQGYRVELGEIEHAMLQHPQVAQAIAAVQGTGADKRLVGYYVRQPGDGLADTELRELLARKLPEYMVPRSYVALDQLPLGANGKVDRKALPDPGEKRAALPRLTPDPRHRHDPFPLTDVQHAYWMGRDEAFELGGVACHGYFEFDCTELDLPRFERAWQLLLARHEMLRSIVQSDGQQRILPEPPEFRVIVLDLRGEPEHVANERLGADRERLSHLVLPADHCPIFRVQATLLPSARTRIHLNVDLIIMDYASFRMVLAELRQLYEDPSVRLPPITASFRDYVLLERQLQESAAYRRSWAYWENRVATLPPAPRLPLACDPAAVRRPRFARRKARIALSSWTKLRDLARSSGLTPSGCVLSVFAEVLATFSEQPEFSINVPIFKRLPVHEDINRVVGDFSTLAVLEVRHTAPSFIDRARAIQRQLWSDLEHVLVSGVKLLGERARRSGEHRAAQMPVVFTSLISHAQLDNTPMLSWLGDEVFAITQTPQVWLDHQVIEDAAGLVLIWDAVEELFPPGMLDAMFESYLRAFEVLADDPRALERESLLLREAPPHASSLHMVFDEQLRPCPPFVTGRVFLGGLHGGRALQSTHHPVSGARLAWYGHRGRVRADGAIDVVAFDPPASEDAALGSDRSLLDPLKKLAFRYGRPGLRREQLGARVELPALEHGAERLQALARRRSFREYSSTPATALQLSSLLGCTAQTEHPDLPAPKLLYGSAGGLYPVQVYVYVKAGRVAGLPAGGYYYDPQKHTLYTLGSDPALGAAYPDVNRGAFESAAFAIFLVAERSAIEPVYGGAWQRFVLLEAGAIAQLLESKAPEFRLGLCQTGGVDERKLSALLGLGPTHEFLHGLLGGPIEEAVLSVAALLCAAGAPAAPRLQRGPAEPEVPASEVELQRELERLWRQVLPVERVSPHDGFFELGGNSLRLVQLVNRIRERFGVSVKIVQLFEHTTIAEQARYLGALLRQETRPGLALEPEAQRSGERVAERAELMRRARGRR